MARLVSEGVALAYEQAGQGEPTLVLVHGVACHRRFWSSQIRHFASHHRTIAVDLRGHGESDAPHQPYTVPAFADDVAWVCKQLGVQRPVVIGHSLGGLVALELGAARPDLPGAVILLDSVLMSPGDRSETIRGLVGGLRGPRPEVALREYFEGFFGPYDDQERKAWVLDQAVRTAPHVTSSVWEESRGWDDADALQSCRVPVLYIDAGTPNADLERARALQPSLALARTIGSGHFNMLEVPEQVNAMVGRFIAITKPTA